MSGKKGDPAEVTLSVAFSEDISVEIFGFSAKGVLAEYKKLKKEFEDE